MYSPESGPGTRTRRDFLRAVGRFGGIDGIGADDSNGCAVAFVIDCLGTDDQWQRKNDDAAQELSHGTHLPLEPSIVHRDIPVDDEVSDC